MEKAKEIIDIYSDEIYALENYMQNASKFNFENSLSNVEFKLDELLALHHLEGIQKQKTDDTSNIDELFACENIS